MANGNLESSDVSSLDRFVEYLLAVVDTQKISFGRDIPTLVAQQAWKELSVAEKKDLVPHIMKAPAECVETVLMILIQINHEATWSKELKSAVASARMELLAGLVAHFIEGAKKSKSTKLLKHFVAAVEKVNQEVYARLLASLVALCESGIARKELSAVLFGADARKKPDVKISDIDALLYLLSLVESPALTKSSSLIASYVHRREDQIAYVIRLADENILSTLMEDEFFDKLSVRNWLYVLDEKSTRTALGRTRERVDGYISQAAHKATNKADFIDFLRIPDEFKSGAQESGRDLLERVTSKSKPLAALLSEEKLLNDVEDLKSQKNAWQKTEADLRTLIQTLETANAELSQARDQAEQGKQLARNTQRQDIKNQAIAEQKKVIEKIFKAFGFAFKKVQSVDCSSKDSVIALLSEVLAGVDIRLVGRPDEVVTFNGSDHKWNLPSSASKGIVAEPGYVWATEGEEHSHEKALLVPIEE
jgi:hypothetical protein